VDVCFITEKYPPVVGGGESHIEALAEGLADRGHAVTVLTETPAWLDGRPRPDDRIAFREVPGLTRACERADFGDALRSLRHALESVERVDVIHVFNRIPAALCGMLRGFLRGRVCLSTFETVIAGKRVFGLWNDFDLELEFARNAAALLAPDAMICGSRLYREWALAEGYPHGLIHVIPFGTDVERFRPDKRRRHDHRARMGWSDAFVVLLPARPIPRKRIEDVIAAMPAVLDAVPEARLVLTDPTRRGDDGYVARLRASIEDLDLAGHVTWLPGLTVDDMPDLMRAADVAVLPADDDGFGIVLIEAMASGAPVVASDVPGHDEAVTDDTGTLYPCGDVRRLAEAILRVARQPDRARVHAARERACSEFSTLRVVARHLDVYHELVRSSGRMATAER
jgi:glycosyltransferase involved in cell wall biosynthesis